LQRPPLSLLLPATAAMKGVDDAFLGVGDKPYVFSLDL
jgi:hypothetical protein